MTKDEAHKLAPDYVDFIERNFDKFDVINAKFSKLRKGQKVITFITDKYTKDFKKIGRYVIARVSSVIKDDYRAVDGPVVRVSDGEYSWRVDGSNYAYPIE